MERAKTTHEVFVWFEDTRFVTMQALQEAQDLLSDEECTRHNRFRFAEDRRDYAMAHALLRRSLSHLFPECDPAEWQFETDPLGKPKLAQGRRRLPSVEFSLSHTRGAIACAVSFARIGIDVERFREGVDYLEIAHSNFADEEVKALVKLPEEERGGRILELWTLKESFLKARGVGLAGGLSSVRFALGEFPDVRFDGSADVDPEDWKFGVYDWEAGLKLALAVDTAGECQVVWPDRDADFYGMTLFGGRRKR